MPGDRPLSQPPDFDPLDPRFPAVPSPFPGGYPTRPDGQPGPGSVPYDEVPPLPPASIPVEDARETGGSGSDEVFDLTPDTGMIPDATGGPPVPLPDPGAIKWDQYAISYPGDGPVLIERRTRRRIGRIIPDAFRMGMPNPSRSQIVAGERTFGGPRVSPFPNDTINTPPGEEFRVERRIPTRIERSDEYYRREAERMQRDTERRLSRRVIEGVAEAVGPRAIGRVLGPIGVIIGEVLTPAELGSGELIPGLELPLPASPDIPAPVITQPEVPTWEPIPPDLPLPPAPAPTSTAPPAPAPAPTSAPSPAPRPARAPAPASPRVPWSRFLSSIILGSLSTPRSSPWSNLPAPNLPAPTSALTTPSTPGAAATSPPIGSPVGQPEPLTGVQTSVSSSAPPRIQTRQRQRECHCDPKPKKRKKPRECVVRGQLMWTSGPKKGKPAGSRCVKF